MPVVGAPLPADVRALLAAASRPLGAQLAAAPRGPMGGLVCAPAVDWPAERPPHRTPAGVAVAVLPLAELEALTRALVPSIAAALAGPTGPGELWCLVRWGEPGAVHHLVVPVTPATPLLGAKRGSA